MRHESDAKAIAVPRAEIGVQAVVGMETETGATK